MDLYERHYVRWIILGGCLILSAILYYFIARAQIIDSKNVGNTLYRVHSTVSTITLHTNYGDIDIHLEPFEAPVTVENFITLTEKGFYNGTQFHKIIKGQFIVGGDPFTKESDITKYGKGGPGYTIRNEFNTLDTATGTVVMFNDGAKTAGSQFMILTSNIPEFYKKYTVFGQVTKGLDVIEKINAIDTDGNNMPVEPVVVSSAVLK